MTAATRPSASRCPDCRADLTGAGACAACGLRLTGREAARLWEVDLELVGLEHSRRALLDEREGLLQLLRTVATTAPAAAPSAEGPPVDWPTAGRTPAEWTPHRVQNLLLTLGGLLLAGAALVFAVVTYERLGAGGRAAVLAALTLAAGLAAPRLRARGLGSTAETVGVVALALAALDAYGLRTLGLAADSAPAVYAAGCAAVLGAAALAYGRLTGLLLVQVLGVVLAQLPVPQLLVHAQAPSGTVALALAALAALDLAVLTRSGRLDEAVRDTVRCAALVVTGAAVAAALLAGLGADEPGRASLALVACAAVVAAASRLTAPAGRALLSGGAVVLLGAALAALLREDAAVTALALAAGSVVAVLAGSRLSRDERTGPVAGALVVAAAAVLAVGLPVAQGLLQPLGWVDVPWSLPAGSSLREALPSAQEWTGPAVTPLVLLAAAATAALAGLALGTRRWTTAPAGALCLAAAVLLPLALDLPFAAGLALLLVLAAAAAAGGAALLGREEALPLMAGGVALALHAAAWSTASQTATLVVLPLVALGCAALAVPRQPAPAVPVLLAGLLATAHVGALGAALDLAPDQVGGLLLVAVAGAAVAAALLDGVRRAGAEGTALDLAPDQVGGLLLVAVAGAVVAAALLDGVRRAGAEGTALVAAAAALLLALGHVGWLSWVLAGLGLLALATALRPDRRRVAVAGGLLLSASSWVRLADAGITAPEPYVLPLAAAALVLGALRRRAEPTTRSWAAYGPGLLLALVPSLLAGLDGDDLTRLLLVGLAALTVLLAGARSRLQAPIAVGAGVLVVVTLDLLGPYAAAAPRWLSLGSAGALLLVVGATYEQRRRDVGRLREGFERLA